MRAGAEGRSRGQISHREHATVNETGDLQKVKQASTVCDVIAPYLKTYLQLCTVGMVVWRRLSPASSDTGILGGQLVVLFGDV